MPIHWVGLYDIAILHRSDSEYFGLKSTAIRFDPLVTQLVCLTLAACDSDISTRAYTYRASTDIQASTQYRRQSDTIGYPQHSGVMCTTPDT